MGLNTFQTCGKHIGLEITAKNNMSTSPGPQFKKDTFIKIYIPTSHPTEKITKHGTKT